MTVAFNDFIVCFIVFLSIILYWFQIDEAADVIQKLHLISQELPSGKYVFIKHAFVILFKYSKVLYSNNCSLCRFEKAKKKIGTKYDEIERSLIEEFVKAHRSDDKGRMKEIATILSHFKGYPQCIDAFIEQSQMVMFSCENVVCVFCFSFSMCLAHFILINLVS